MTTDAHPTIPSILYTNPADVSALTRNPVDQATIDIAVITATADGDAGEAERERIGEIVCLLVGVKRDDPTLRTYVDQCIDRANEGGLEDQLDGAVERLPDDASRRRAFRFSAAVALVDGWLDRGEIRLMNELARMLEIAPADAVALLDEVRHIVRPEG